MSGEDKRINAITDLEDFRFGKDEMNLAEFALAGISARRGERSQKTLIHRDQVFDPEKRVYVPRELAISGSDQYGLPLGPDDDVLLACFQLSRLQDFRSPELPFTRYEIITLLKWSHESHYYRRIKTGLRRWKGLTVYSDRNFWDHQAKGFVDRDFSIIAELEFFDRERADGSSRKSRLVWSDFVFRNCQSGFIKNLDWQFYVGLKSPVAKRLYRFLDKLFWRDKPRFVFDVRELAVRHVGLSSDQDNHGIMRELKKGIAELEAKWKLLQPLPVDKRFRRIGHGKWEVEFTSQKPPRRSRSPRPTSPLENLVDALTSRGVGRNEARKLVQGHSASDIQKQLEAFDYRRQGPGRGKGIESPGAFLASAIRGGYAAPSGFTSSAEKTAKERAAQLRHLESTRFTRALEDELDAERSAATKLVEEYLNALTAAGELQAFEEQAAIESPLRSVYEEARAAGGARFERWRRILLHQAARERLTKPSDVAKGPSAVDGRDTEPTGNIGQQLELQPSQSNSRLPATRDGS